MDSEDLSQKCQYLMNIVAETRKRFGKMCIEYDQKTLLVEKKLLNLQVETMSNLRFKPKINVQCLDLYEGSLKESEDFLFEISEQQRRIEEVTKKLKDTHEVVTQLDTDSIGKKLRVPLTAEAILASAKAKEVKKEVNSPDQVSSLDLYEGSLKDSEDFLFEIAEKQRRIEEVTKKFKDTHEVVSQLDTDSIGKKLRVPLTAEAILASAKAKEVKKEVNSPDQVSSLDLYEGSLKESEDFLFEIAEQQRRIEEVTKKLKDTHKVVSQLDTDSTGKKLRVPLKAEAILASAKAKEVKKEVNSPDQVSSLDLYEGSLKDSKDFLFEIAKNNDILKK